MKSKARLLINLDPRLMKELRKAAADENVPMVEIIRRALNCYLRETNDRWDRALSVAGKYASGLTDVSENHDRYFDDAIYR